MRRIAIVPGETKVSESVSAFTLSSLPEIGTYYKINHYESESLSLLSCSIQLPADQDVAYNHAAF